MDDDIHVQINNYDSYQARPSCLDNLASEVSKVPIIRIYGGLVFYHKSIKYSFNTLIHVHNVYPYVYVSCDYEFLCKQQETVHIRRMMTYLESAMAASFKRKRGSKEKDDEPEEDIPADTGKRRFIASITLCKGVPVYGYTVGYRLFYKINFLAPLYKSKFTNMFNEGHIILSPFAEPRFHFEIFDSHIPYTSQFLTDFNLFSCNWVQLGGCYFRYPVIQQLEQTGHMTVLSSYLKKFIDHNVLNLDFTRMGKSVLELDIKSNQIINRRFLIEKTNNCNFDNFNVSNKDINLSSIDLIIKEINYQSVLNRTNFEFNGGIMDASNKDTKWTNDLELRKLLNYSIKITNSIRNSDVKSYASKFLENFNTRLASYPTIFQVIDKEKVYLNSNVMMSDLYEYKDVNELFMGQRDISQLATSSMDTMGSGGDEVEEGVEEIDGIESDNGDGNKAGDQFTDIGEEEDEEEEKEEKEELSEQEEVVEADMDFDETFNDSQLFLDLTQKMPTKRKGHEIDEDPLSRESILQDFDQSGIVRINYDDPYYDKESDLPPRPLIFSNKKIKVPYKSEETIPFVSIDSFQVSKTLRDQMATNERLSMQNWQYSIPPPTKTEIIQSYEQQKEDHSTNLKYKSQLEMPFTKSNDFKFSNHETVERRPDDFIQLTNFLMEIHVNTDTNKLPNPLTDEVSMIFYKYVDSNMMFPETSKKVGVLVNKKSLQLNFRPETLIKELDEVNIEVLDNEMAIINKLIEVVDYFDPDILSGFEINSMSWGYLVERLRKTVNVNILSSLGRSKEHNNGKFGDRWGYTHTSFVKVTGRFTLNVWRMIRKEISLNNYSFENCCHHIHHREFPKLSNLKLSNLLKDGNNNEMLFVLRFYFNKVNILQYFIDSQDIIDKNVEMSRLIGVDFNSNFYRGSQFKVESILGRLCKAESFLLNSPSKTHIHYMKALEQIPLIMEPDSNFYKSPLIVLDFQSLYPSIIIAYNLCFSTFVCKLHGFKPGKNPIGYLNHMPLPPMILDLLKKNNCINITPNGLVFVNSRIRKSVLATMLQEILSLRINIKNFLSNFSKASNAQLFRVFNSRQLALKLIANVTYGYTSATFSGRMPNSDIADAIVATGREILTKSIDMIEKSQYGCKVVYGDTDSLFVYLPGKSKDDAFEIGEKLAETITSEFPDPVKLKFEKVYHPCVLLSKKRYVGNMYEYRDQIKPKFDAKGIETIRRDGIPAQQKILEKALKILFETSNLSSVKEYVMGEFNKILASKVIIKDFCFAKEVRYGTYKNETYLPPGAIVAQKKVENDERSEPQYRERVPYVVYLDRTKQRLKDRCISPEEFIQSLNTPEPLQLDYEYYITKVLIPPLERIFNLMGVDIQLWYKELPKPAIDTKTAINITNFKFVHKKSCIHCGKKVEDTHQYLCQDCLADIPNLVLSANTNVRDLQFKQKQLNAICRQCVSSTLNSCKTHQIYDECINQDCVNYFNQVKTRNELKKAYTELETIGDILDN